VSADRLAELVAMSLRSTANAPEAPDAHSSGRALLRPETTAVLAGESFLAIDSRETSVVAADETLARADGADHAPTKQPRREEPEHTIVSAAPADGADDQAAVDRFLRSDPAALAWLRAAVETNARALLLEQPADLGYFAEAVDVLGEHAAGRAMLRAVAARAEYRPQTDAPMVDEAAQRPPSASTPEATCPQSMPTANTRAMRPASGARARSRPVVRLRWLRAHGAVVVAALGDEERVERGRPAIRAVNEPRCGSIRKTSPGPT
jgi:hypothetical protein